jgi:hypothetical protein
MQPSQTSSPWPKRILITGVVLAVCGVVAFALIGESYASLADPRETSEHSAEIGEINSMTLEEGCWVVNVEGSDDDYITQFNYVEDGAAGDSVDDDCRTDFQTVATDVDFATITKLNIEKESEIFITIDCEEGGECDEPLLLTNGDDAATEQMKAMLIPGGLCFTGFVLIPLGWILISINRGKEAAVQLIQNPGAPVMPMENDPRMNQEMLTTDQLYKLVRGEMPVEEDRASDVPSPFANADTRVRSSTQSKVGGSINRASSYTPENPPTDESWKNWDEA